MIATSYAVSNSWLNCVVTAIQASFLKPKSDRLPRLTFPCINSMILNVFAGSLQHSCTLLMPSKGNCLACRPVKGLARVSRWSLTTIMATGHECNNEDDVEPESNIYSG